ncbi:hypothetical protein [Fusobacterium phage Fnu1]|uniref:Uncharacterized protein n=1 Tax=Fusobacterium phage Fnu1 TaxID=2530024 RepID=A0A481W697_9CAUD|nr:hypothetical protein KMD24_gp165 [Fusobacterium phage Fnu1]QBJ04160.1 hypothetical protein [Fusobacterium phage Fnu1]
MKVSKLNWLNIGRGYESIRLILNKKKVEAMGYDRDKNNEVVIDYDIENQTITIKPFKPTKYKTPNIIASVILNMKGNFVLEDVVREVKRLDENAVNIKEIKEKLEVMNEYGLIGQTELYYFSVPSKISI